MPHLGHLQTISFMKMAARILAKFTKFCQIAFIPYYYSNIGRRTRRGARIDHNPLYNFPGSFVQEPQRNSSVTHYRIAVAVLSIAFLLALTAIALLSMKQTQAKSIGIKQLQQRLLGEYQRKYSDLWH